MVRLCRANESLQRDNRAKDSALQQSKVAIDLILGLYQELGKEIPAEALQRLSVAQTIATGSSHVGSEFTNNMDGNGHYGDDLDGTNIDNIHGSNQHSGNKALGDGAA